MSEKSQCVLLAEYNRLMNGRIIEASAGLSVAGLAEDKGAFFSSVIGTLNHIMIGDILWLKRFASHPSAYVSLEPLSKIKKPDRLDLVLFADLSVFAEEREVLDSIIIAWCADLKEVDLDQPLGYTSHNGERHKKRMGDLVLHMFLHQVHHRGQITTLLSQAGIDFGETDLPEIVPDEV
ncbi:putative damage-inducible protein DinB [Thiogranum longum]|uniref:Putative damage-inducible protein DinB n=1 Tax=Thiogranum longum TaxID=1537524 RepID=A0A4R1HCU3_9GAMM|nr:DinB family protein [Thiogranum longum]TCK19278.1 putative damage-inducible protein DinB [Thiogranum longum]